MTRIADRLKENSSDLEKGFTDLDFSSRIDTLLKDDEPDYNMTLRYGFSFYL